MFWHQQQQKHKMNQIFCFVFFYFCSFGQYWWWWWKIEGKTKNNDIDKVFFCMWTKIKPKKNWWKMIVINDFCFKWTREKKERTGKETTITYWQIVWLFWYYGQNWNFVLTFEIFKWRWMIFFFVVVGWQKLFIFFWYEQKKHFGRSNFRSHEQQLVMMMMMMRKWRYNNNRIIIWILIQRDHTHIRYLLEWNSFF